MADLQDRKLSDFLPVRGDGWATMFFLSAVLGAALSCLYLVLRWTEGWPWSALFIWASLAPSVALGLFFWLFGSWKALRRFWQRNIRGIMVYGYQMADGSLSLTHYGNYRHVGYPHILPVHLKPVEIIVTIGGWLNRQYNRILSKDEEFKGWQVRCNSEMTRNASHRVQLVVDLVDLHGAVVTLGIGDALQILSKIADDQSAKKFSLWGNYSWFLAIPIWFHDAQASNATIEVIVQAIIQIEDTTRFVYSKGGAKVKQYLIGELMRILPTDHPRLKWLDEYYGGKAGK